MSGPRDIRDGRALAPVLVALLREDPGETPRLAIAAPAVGLWRGGPGPGALVKPGDALGALEILGTLHRLEAPAGARGVVAWRGSPDAAQPLRARVPVAHGQTLLLLDPGAVPGMAAADEPAAAPADAATDALAFCAPMSGRFYSRPGPDKPPFVQVGDVIRAGATVCLLEVMKTFNRLTYGGAGLPASARVTAIVPRDEEDLSAGDVILRIEEDPPPR